MQDVPFQIPVTHAPSEIAAHNFAEWVKTWPAWAFIALMLFLALWTLLWLFLPFMIWAMWGNLQAIRHNTRLLAERLMRDVPR